MSTSELSHRQHQILELVAQGMTNREIGERLRRSSYTIASNIKGICGKLHARDRSHAVSRGYQCGLLSIPDHVETAGQTVGQVCGDVEFADRLPGDVAFVQALARVRTQLEAARDEIAELRSGRAA